MEGNRTNAEQQQQVEQQRAVTVAAPVVRSAAPEAGEWLMLPIETPCFRIDTFGNHDLGTHGWNASYSVPWGYWTGTLYGY
ncbi:hypothetical protein SY87_23740 [Burkholderia pseudomallei]|nr:hypothetical protein SY87_23740 [Burkholderia pseudomallei]